MKYYKNYGKISIDATYFLGHFGTMGKMYEGRDFMNNNKGNKGFITFVIIIVLVTVTEFILFIKPGVLTEKRRERLRNEGSGTSVAQSDGGRGKNTISGGSKVSTEETGEKTQKSTAEATDDTTEKKTKKTTASVTEESTEKVTEKTTEKKTKKTTEVSTEESTEKTTEKKTKKTTAETTEESTEKTTEKKTKKTTEVKTEETTEESDFFSTDERPGLRDFDWFIEDYMNGNYIENAVDITDHKALNGGWKVMLFTDPYNTMNSYSLRFLNGTMTTSGNKVKLTLDYYRMYEGGDGSYVDETDRQKETFSSEWQNMFVEFDTGYSKITVYYFCEKGGKQYAIGNVEWISGEYGYFAMVRP